MALNHALLVLTHTTALLQSHTALVMACTALLLTITPLLLTQITLLLMRPARLRISEPALLRTVLALELTRTFKLLPLASLSTAVPRNWQPQARTLLA